MNYKMWLLKIFIFVFISNMAHSAEAAPKIEIVTPDADIGSMEKGPKIDLKIELKNAGTDDLVITNVYSGCGCLEVTDERWLSAYPKNIPDSPVGDANNAIKPVAIKPQDNIIISARIDTNKVSGQFERALHVISNDPDKKDVVWKVKGNAMERPDQQQAANSAGPADVSSDKNKGINIMVFYLPGCRECLEITGKFLPQLKKRYGDNVSISYYNMDDPVSFSLLLDLQNKHNKKKNMFFNPKPPAVFIGNRLLNGEKDVKKNLERAILTILKSRI